MPMRIEEDPITGATYVTLRDNSVARTVDVTDLITVDLDGAGDVVGVDFAMPPSELTPDEVRSILSTYPELRAAVLLAGSPRGVAPVSIEMLTVTAVTWSASNRPGWYARPTGADIASLTVSA